jgi:hypothetical protein
MSDGPHRSLNMHRSWKRLAEYADNNAHSINDVASAFLPALAHTCDLEAPPSLLQDLNRIFGEKQRGLFKDQKIDEIAALRRGVAGYALANAILDSAEKCAAKGLLGNEALIGAVTEGLLNRAARANRQIEEHYYRESTEGRSKDVRDRMESALNNAALETLARHRLNMQGTVKSPRSIKQSGLDDGVQLP